MAIEVTLYTPHPQQQSVHDAPERFKVLNWGRRTGKSKFSVNYALLKAVQEPGRYWVVAPTYKQAKNIYWYDLIKREVPREVISKMNEQELIVQLKVKDKDGIPATIELKGADNEDSLRGAGVKGVVLDEYAFMKPMVWEQIIRPMLADSKGWAVFISTPNGFNHFYDITEQAKARKDWFYSHATLYDNPHIDRLEIEDIRQETNLDTFAQEYLAEFRKLRGLVFSEFAREIHTFNPLTFQLPKKGLWGMGVDHGVTNPTAGVFVFIDYDNNYYIMDELYETGLDTDQIARLLRQKMGANYFTYRVCDQAAAQFILDLNALHNFGIIGQPKTKDSIEGGIRLVKDMLKVQEGTGKPKLFVSERCKNFIWEMETYHYEDKKDDRNPTERPVDENNHLMDAFRYLRLATSIPAVREREKRAKIYSEVTGRVIGYEGDGYRQVDGFEQTPVW